MVIALKNNAIRDSALLQKLDLVNEIVPGLIRDRDRSVSRWVDGVSGYSHEFENPFKPLPEEAHQSTPWQAPSRDPSPESLAAPPQSQRIASWARSVSEYSPPNPFIPLPEEHTPHIQEASHSVKASSRRDASEYQRKAAALSGVQTQQRREYEGYPTPPPTLHSGHSTSVMGSSKHRDILGYPSPPPTKYSNPSTHRSNTTMTASNKKKSKSRTKDKASSSVPVIQEEMEPIESHSSGWFSPSSQYPSDQPAVLTIPAENSARHATPVKSNRKRHSQGFVTRPKQSPYVYSSATETGSEEDDETLPTIIVPGMDNSHYAPYYSPHYSTGRDYYQPASPVVTPAQASVPTIIIQPAQQPVSQHQRHYSEPWIPPAPNEASGIPASRKEQKPLMKRLFNGISDVAKFSAKR